MLVANTEKKQSVISGKLVSGEEFVGTVVDSTTNYVVLRKPLLIGMSSGLVPVLDSSGNPVYDPATGSIKTTEHQEVVFAPFMLSLNADSEITIYRTQIIASGDASDLVMFKYNNIIESL